MSSIRNKFLDNQNQRIFIKNHIRVLFKNNEYFILIFLNLLDIAHS